MPIARPTLSQRVLRVLPSARLLDLARNVLEPTLSGGQQVRLARLHESAAIERELGRNVSELRRSRWADELVVTSRNRAVGARLAGRIARVVPFGYHERLAGPIVPAASGARDIDLLVLGRDVTAQRRGRVLAALRRSGLEPVVIDAGFYGAERHALLARSRVVLDIHRVPNNASGLRWLLASAAGAAVVAERTGDDWLGPTQDSEVLEAAIADIPRAARSLILDEDRRHAMVDAAQARLGSDMAMTSVLARLLSTAGWAASVAD